MTEPTDRLAVLYEQVTQAIVAAEQLADAHDPGAPRAYGHVSELEDAISVLLPASSAEGAIARRGAVRAALAAADHGRARRLAGRYFAEHAAPVALQEELRALLAHGDHTTTTRSTHHMTTRTLKLSPDVAAVLAEATVDADVVKLPAGLERALYAAVNKALAAIGGAWDRRRGGHVFPDGVDPAARLAELLDTGKATSARAAGFFATPEALITDLVAVAQVLPHHQVLEPSAGHGAIAARLVAIVGADNLTIVELLEENCRVLRGRGYAPIQADFLTVELDATFDRIVMNPPFDGRRDLRHVQRAFDLLAPGGRLVAVMAAGVTFRNDRATSAFRDLVARNGSVTSNPDGAFAASGTNVSTVTVLLDKPLAPFAGAGSSACQAVTAGQAPTHHNHGKD